MRFLTKIESGVDAGNRPITAIIWLGTRTNTVGRCGLPADGAGEGDGQVSAQPVGQRDAVRDEILAGPAGLPQGDGGRGIGDQDRSSLLPADP